MRAEREPHRAIGIHELPEIGPAAVTLGVFDGVHRGHQALLATTARVARERGWSSVALVFDPHPDEVLRPGTHVPRLASLATILGRIESDLGVDHALPLRFDDELRGYTVEAFLAAFAPAIALRAIVVSPESAFGKGRGGTVARLREIGAEADFAVVTVDAVLHQGAPISSMRIRAALERGAIGEAAALGYAPGFSATVDGDRLAFDYLPALPPPGRFRAVLRPAMGERAVDIMVEVDEQGAVRIRMDRPGSSRPPTGARVVLELTSRA